MLSLAATTSCWAADHQDDPRGFDAEQKTTMMFRDAEPIETITRIARDTAGRSRLELDGATVIMDPLERVIWFADRTGRALRHEMSEHRVELAERGRVPSAIATDAPKEDLATSEIVEQKKVEWNGFPAELNVMSVTAAPDPTIGVEPRVIETEFLVAFIEGIRMPVKMETRGTARMPSVTMETTSFRHLVGAALDPVFRPPDEWTVVDDPSQLSEQPTSAWFPMLPEGFFGER